MSKKKIFNIVTFSILVLSIILSIVLKSSSVINTIFRIVGIIDSVVMAVYAIAKSDRLYKVSLVMILLTVALSYFIPQTSYQYGVLQRGAINPVTLADVYVYTIYSANVFVPAFTYILAIGAFYFILKKTGKYETLINNVAATFNKNKGLFIVLTVFVLGLVTFFTGEFYTLLIFVPFLISVVRKLGYGKETAVLSTVGAILLGNAGALFTEDAYNQYLMGTNPYAQVSRSQIMELLKNDLFNKVLVVLIGLVALVAFILVFCNKPANTDLKKEKDSKLVPLHVTLWSTFVLLILGFVKWSGLFGFTGFDKFLETLRKWTVQKVSMFNAFGGQTVAAFGTWQLFNASVLFILITVIIALIYKIKVKDFIESYVEGFKKAFPYAAFVVLAIIVLANVAYSGIYYTLIVDVTSKTVNVFTTTISGIFAAIFCPDSVNAAQFTIRISSLTKATGFQSVLTVTYQAIYNLFLLISPTSILLLLGLRYTNTSYKEWIKYIFKFFIVLFVTILVVITVCYTGLKLSSIGAIVLLVGALGLISYLRITKVSKTIVKNETKKEEKKEEKVEVKKAPAKKTTTKKSPAKKTTKKTNKK